MKTEEEIKDKLKEMEQMSDYAFRRKLNDFGKACYDKAKALEWVLED